MGGKKGELSLITSKTSEFPMLTNITKWFQVRCQHRRGKRSAQALTQSNSSQEVVRRQRSWPSLSHTSIWTRVKGQGQEVSLDTLKSHFSLEICLGLEVGVRKLTQTLTQSHFGLGSGPQRFPPAP